MMIDFLKTYLAELIAVLALIQPWVIALWRKFIRPGRVDFFETGKIEIGYSNFASTIGLNGTLRSVDQDFYIRQMKLIVTKRKDSSKHEFEWAVFRDTKINLHDKKALQVELPYGFMLSSKSPHRLNIQFHDMSQQVELTPIFNDLNAKWDAFVEKMYPVDQQLSDTEAVYLAKTNELLDVFTEGDDATDAYGKFNREFYWEKGQYELTLFIYTSSPDKVFSKTWNFLLTDVQADHVRLNSLSLVEVACDKTVDDWNFAYPMYQKAPR